MYRFLQHNRLYKCNFLSVIYLFILRIYLGEILISRCQRNFTIDDSINYFNGRILVGNGKIYFTELLAFLQSKFPLKLYPH